MAKLLAVENLTAGYGDATVLEDVDLSLEEGGSLALLGRNGMGKTTLLVTLMGLTRMRRGALRWRGRDLAVMPTHRRSRSGIGWVPQERYMWGSLTVEEHLTAVARPGPWNVARIYVGAHMPLDVIGGAHGPVRGTSPGSTSSSPASRNGVRISATSSPAASSRCWRSPGP